MFPLQELSQNKVGITSDECKLDVHSIAELQSKNIPTTDDSPKYNYKTMRADGDGSYRKLANLFDHYFSHVV